MQQMTRPEFEAYRQRVEAALARFERTLGESERAGFEEIAAAAREVIGIRREYLDASERGAPVEVMRDAGKGDGNTGEPGRGQGDRPDEAVAREALGRISDAEEFLALATRAWRDPTPYRREVDEAYAVAGRLAASGNSILREEAAKMPSLRDAMLSFESSGILDELRTGARAPRPMRRKEGRWVAVEPIRHHNKCRVCSR